VRAGQDPHHGALAGAILPDQGMDLPPADPKRRSVEGPDASEYLSNARHVDEHWQRRLACR